MKTIFVFFALLALAMGEPLCVRDDSNGQPACNAEEMTQRFWRNNWDPTAYWECVTAGTAATARRCPTEGMFDSATLTCIRWDLWVWTPTCKPPSMLV
ncbi:uncharacterized protein LOC109402619 [Aedes albopictus]|uniref:Chitin-binding type-2 domain-containing protein n=1 Tax=Aedes albopictus TaxID=7160 RepID=A0ABM1ZX05_AEDAL|nr:uncharacterized protein LOC109406596 [Aedes albopictus]